MIAREDYALTLRLMLALLITYALTAIILHYGAIGLAIWTSDETAVFTATLLSYPLFAISFLLLFLCTKHLPKRYWLLGLALSWLGYLTL